MSYKKGRKFRYKRDNGEEIELRLLFEDENNYYFSDYKGRKWTCPKDEDRKHLFPIQQSGRRKKRKQSKSTGTRYIDYTSKSFKSSAGSYKVTDAYSLDVSKLPRPNGPGPSANDMKTDYGYSRMDAKSPYAEGTPRMRYRNSRKYGRI